MNRQEFVNEILQGKGGTPKPEATAYAPANIALCKYWGKRDRELNLPITSSLSISLGRLGTQTTIGLCDNNDQFRLNGEAVDSETAFARRLSSYLDLYREPGEYFSVATENSIPTAAGLASSASGFGALVLALDDLYDWKLSRRELSMLARIGSGSASRSVYDGFAIWHAGAADDGSDSYAEQLSTEWPEFCIGLNLIDAGPKGTGSTEGMIRTTKTSILYDAWPKQVEQDLATIKQAVSEEDFSMLGMTAERNALAMHATMFAADPPLIYWQPETVATIHRIHQLRRNGVEIYLTMDAGPNVKFLFQEQDCERVLAEFPDLIIAQPFKQR